MVPSAMLHLAGGDMDFDKILILWLSTGPVTFSVTPILKKNYSLFRKLESSRGT